MPPYIREFIEDELKKGDVVVTVAYYVKGDENMAREIAKSSLTFSGEGRIKNSEAVVDIFGYLNRIVKYSRLNILVYVNSQLLNEIKPKEIYAIEHIPQLPT